MALFILFFVGIGAGFAAGMLTMRSSSYQLAHLAGQRKAYKTAIEAIQDRGDVAVLVAPKGELRIGLMRAQTAGQIEMDLRDLLAKVR